MIIAGFVKQFNSEEDTPYRPCMMINERLICTWDNGLVSSEVLGAGIKLFWKHFVVCNDDVNGFKESKKWLMFKIEDLINKKEIEKVDDDNSFRFLMLDEEEEKTVSDGILSDG